MGWTLVIIYFIGWHIGMYGMFKKAGITPWKALVPFYGTWYIVEKCNIKKIWFWLQLIPIAGQFITIWIGIIFVMNFGKFSLWDHTLVVFLPFLYLPYLGFSKGNPYKGEKVIKLYKKTVVREWIDAAVFAVVAATLIRTFIFEAYAIPSGSMEKTLLVNDYLFVNKMAYGPRLPMTPISFPFVHNIMPFSQTQVSYSKIVELPYKRLPGFTPVKRNDVVVFNFPQGDTIINLPGYGSLRPYYQKVREWGSRQAVWDTFGANIIVHPLDKTDNYIKRCVAVGGDTLQIKDSYVYIDGKPAFVPEFSQQTYTVRTNGQPLDFDELKSDYNIEIRNDGDGEELELYQDQLQQEFHDYKTYTIELTASDAATIKKLPFVTSVERYVTPSNPLESKVEFFPYDSTDTTKKYSLDNYGPIYIPQKGATITLTKDNIALYRRLIRNYEGHTLEETGNQFIIDGKPTDKYTFKYNYYWMMGDNRHGSQDSRYWGFVPETCIVGRASFIMFSWYKGIRWRRMFSDIK
ncbi:MAG TPA: S26 family signal peptidase [Chitinophagaceae bacterium]|nr:S26 family signal peptidase [Chitinophagaceae bacterium]